MKRRWIGLLSLFVSFLQALQVEPWIGEVYQFHFQSSYRYSRFTSFQNGTPPLSSPFHANQIGFGLDVSLSPEWNFDADVVVADTSAMSFNFQSGAIQARYLWLDDIVGDPITLTTGVSLKGTIGAALRDISCPSHGYLDVEANMAIGKEFCASENLLFRLWAFGALGQATQGSPWVRGIVGFDANLYERHRLDLVAQGVNGYGRKSHVNLEHFFGYGKVREKAIDLGVSYGYCFDVWGTLRFGYFYRVLAKSAPQRVNAWILSYELPFSL